jgi:protein subunit release factor B
MRLKENKAKNKEYVFSITKDDFIVQTFRSGGKGGQNQNKVESGVRIIHPASGAVCESRNHRDQPQNKKEAFGRLVQSPKFKAWHRIETAKRMLSIKDRRELEAQVDFLMADRFLQVETF